MSLTLIQNKKISSKKNIFALFCLVSIFSLSVFKANSQNYGVSIDLNIDLQTLNSYTPPFYEGKALAGEEADVKALASVEVKTVAGTFDESKFFYAWTYNGYPVVDYSKTGGNILRFSLYSMQRENILKLQVYENNKKENLLAEKTLRIAPRKILPIIYKKYENSLKTYSNAINKKYENYAVNKGEEFEVLAEPFYFSSKDGLNNLRYTWSVNNIPGNIDEENTNVFYYKTPSNTSKNFGISLKVENSTKIMQSAETVLNFVLNR